MSNHPLTRALSQTIIPSCLGIIAVTFVLISFYSGITKELCRNADHYTARQIHDMQLEKSCKPEELPQ